MKLWKLDGEGGLELTFPCPADPLSINEAHRLHWAPRRKRTDPWREWAYLTAASFLRANFWTPTPVTIQVVIPFRTNARRDPHNYVGTVVKAVVDGLGPGTTGKKAVQGANLIPDDTPEWATVLEPVLDIQKDKTQPLTARVIIKPRSTP